MSFVNDGSCNSDVCQIQVGVSVFGEAIHAQAFLQATGASPCSTAHHDEDCMNNIANGQTD